MVEDEDTANAQLSGFRFGQLWYNDNRCSLYFHLLPVCHYSFRLQILMVSGGTNFLYCFGYICVHGVYSKVMDGKGRDEALLTTHVNKNRKNYQKSFIKVQSYQKSTINCDNTELKKHLTFTVSC